MTRITPTIDVYVRSDGADTTDTPLLVKGIDPVMVTYLVFDVPKPDGALQGVTLTLTALEAVGRSLTVYTTNNKAPADVTWETRPVLRTRVGTIPSVAAGENAIALPSSVIPADGGRIWLAITNGVYPIVRFESSETSTPPTLEVKTVLEGIQVWPRKDLVELAPSGASSFVYVDPVAGVDTNDGSQATPVATVQRAVDLISGPTEIRVQGNATYNPQSGIALPSSGTPVWLRAMGDKHAVLDFGGRADTGVRANLRPLNMAGMEIVRANFQGGLMGSGSTWEQNIFRDCEAEFDTPYTGLDLEGVKCQAGDAVYRDNLMFRCGQYWGEGRGILLNAARRCTVEGNQFWWGRKEGTRDATPPAVDNEYLRNVFAMWWIGMNTESTAGTLFEDNLVAWCVYGMCTKHNYSNPAKWPDVPPLQPASVDPSLTHWVKFHHNTVIDSMNAAFWWPGPVPFGDFVSVQHNLFCGSNSSYANVIMNSTIRGDNFILDNNAYVTSGIPNVPRFLFKQYGGTTFDSPDLATTRVKTGFEMNGVELSLEQAGFMDYDRGDYRPTADRPLANDGRPFGASGIPALDVTYNDHRPIAVEAQFNDRLSSRMINGDTGDVYFAGTANDTDTATFTLADDTPPFNVLRYAPWAATATQSVKQFDLQFAGPDGVFTTHSTVRFHDSEGASYHINLGDPVTAKYVRFLNAIDWAGAAADPPNGVEIGEVSVGTVSLAGSPNTQVT